MVLGIGLEVVNVDGGQPRDEQLQLLLVEDGYQLLGDDLVEPFQEALDLGPDGSRHLHLAGQLDVLPLVGLGHRNAVSTGLEIFRLCLPKFLNLSGDMFLKCSPATETRI